jgi:hypothetical protein
VEPPCFSVFDHTRQEGVREPDEGPLAAALEVPDATNWPRLSVGAILRQRSENGDGGRWSQHEFRLVPATIDHLARRTAFTAED